MPIRQRIGWVLFLVSAILFTSAGLRDGDPLVVSASVVFGVACLFFLIREKA